MSILDPQLMVCKLNIKPSGFPRKFSQSHHFTSAELGFNFQVCSPAKDIACLLCSIYGSTLQQNSRTLTGPSFSFGKSDRESWTFSLGSCMTWQAQSRGLCFTFIQCCCCRLPTSSSSSSSPCSVWCSSSSRSGSEHVSLCRFSVFSPLEFRALRTT